MSEGDRKPIPLSNLWQGIYVTLPSLTIPLVFTEMTNPPEDDDSLTPANQEPYDEEVDANEPNSEDGDGEQNDDENQDTVNESHDQLNDDDIDANYCLDDQPFEPYDDYEFDYIYNDD